MIAIEINARILRFAAIQPSVEFIFGQSKCHPYYGWFTSEVILAACAKKEVIQPEGVKEERK